MKKAWKFSHTITGDAATGERYFRREHINDEFWREVEKGNHILFVAPRRVGKTSIMKDLADNPKGGYNCIYQNIEGVKTRNEFYRRLFEIIMQCIERSKTQKVA
jgi:predicted AAA+ superfamily ATPase